MQQQKILEWQFYEINNFEARKKTKNILEILFFIYIEHVKYQKATCYRASVNDWSY